MTPLERIEGLQNFGYDLEEARFLCTAALHSGFFLRRHFLSFINGMKGWKDVVLLNKLKANGHCRVTFFRHSRMVYHLSAKPLYEALGEKDNRNRREHQPSGRARIIVYGACQRRQDGHRDEEGERQIG